MISPTHSDDRESLSALFDGELHGDALRFAHKRLAQDVQWRQACGSWLLAGDVLRGRAVAAAPADFAERVRLAMVQEAAATVAPVTMTGSRRGWVGGAALAASVAVAAWFVASPADDATPAAMPAAAIATAAPARAEPTTPVALPSPTAREIASSPLRSQAARVANAGSRPSPRAIAAAAPASVPGPSVASVASVASATSAGIDANAPVDPFRLPPAQAGSRPWPRAVLPNYPVAGALTAGYSGQPQNSGALASDAPGFYPFEPRLPPTAELVAPADSRTP